MSPANDYGMESSYSALVSGCAIVDQPEREWLVVSGEDRRRFVNGLVTCNVRELNAGNGVYGFFTNPKGRILADVVVTASEQTLLLDLPAGRARSVAEHMLRYKVADRVEVEVAEARSQFVVAGPGADAVLDQLLDQTQANGRWSHWHVNGLSLHREHRLGIPAMRVFGSAQDIEALARRLEDTGATLVGAGVVSMVRVERGVPWCGIDYGEENFPQETGLETEAVSYTKGCYLGQEIVARIHHLGQVNRHCRGLRGTDSAIKAGSDLFFGGEKVGEVTSACYSLAIDAPIALAMVHRKAEEAVTLADGAQLSLVELPFVSESG